jgi:signal transduction histidine kinase
MMTDLDKQTQEIIGSVNELLELSEAESHQYYIRNDKVKLNVLCQALLDEQKLRTDKPLEMQTKLLTADHLVVNTNEEALKKVIRHLLQNAIKFTDRGRITLSTQPLPDGVQIIVEDTGTGIPVKYQEKVFEKFFKIDTFKQGMGLGLTVSRHIARLMGGDLLIDPAYTGGTRFVFTLKKEAKD